MARRIESLAVSIEELEQLVEGAGRAPLSEEGQRKLKAAVSTLGVMAELLADQDTTIQKLRELLLPVRTSEKTRKVLDPAEAEETKPKRRVSASGKKGHGRKGAAAYVSAQNISVAHPTLQRADRCPECQKGKVYPLDRPKSLIRIIGQAPVEATVYNLDALRCNLCGEVFTAPPPAGVRADKYDVTAVGMIAVLKYGSGVPFRRLQWLESQLGIPLAAATQWQLVWEAAVRLDPVWVELLRQAAQGHLLHNDDTSMRILRFRREVHDARTGLFTSGIVSVLAGHRIAVFLTGRQHAGENLADLLRQRAAELMPPIQMCDALSRNTPASLQVILGNCLAHYLGSGVIRSECAQVV
jgi:transposase